MSGLKLRRDESWELDPIPFPGRTVSRVGRWDPQPTQGAPEAHGRKTGVLDSIGHAERAMSLVERHTRDLVGSIGLGGPDRPKAA